MSFEFKPQNETPVEYQPPKIPILGNFSLLLIFGVLAVVGGILGWSPAKNAIRDAWARSHANEAMTSMEEDNMGHAIAELIEARKLSPEEPEVLRAIIAYLKLVKGDRRELAYHLRLLATKMPLSPEEQLLYGSCLIDLGRVDEARRVFEALDKDLSRTPDGLALQARLQAAEGQTDAAAATARQSRLLDKDSPEAQLQLAIENSRSAFPEYRNQSWKAYWDLCQLPPPVGIAAAHAILQDTRLTAEDAKRLLPIIEAHPHADLTIRLEIVSALIRFFPDQKAELIRREVSRFEDEKTGTLIEMAAWLAAHHEHAILLQLIPPQLATSSRPLFTALIKALTGEGRWQEMKQILTSKRPPVSNTLVSIWLADAESHLQPDLKESRRQLSFAISSATASHEYEELELASGLAERLGMPDMALQGLFQLAAAVEPRRSELLQRAKTIAMSSKDTRALMQVTRRLLELHPANAQMAEELSYLRLLLGEEMETVMTDAATSPALFKALAAYRLGDRTTLQTVMNGLQKPESMPPGRRAVLSGLLATTGKPAEAYQIAEKVPEGLLLDEELAFLKLAR